MAVGDRVGAGQVLATADTSDLETEIREVTASLERAQLTLSEAESDLESASDETQAAIDSINSQLDVLELQLAQAQDTRDEAASGSAEKVQAKITIIDTKASIDEVEDQKAELKAERSAGYPELTIAVGVAEQTVADLEQELVPLAANADLAVRVVKARPRGLLLQLLDLSVIEQCSPFLRRMEANQRGLPVFTFKQRFPDIGRVLPAIAATACQEHRQGDGKDTRCAARFVHRSLPLSNWSALQWMARSRASRSSQVSSIDRMARILLLI